MNPLTTRRLRVTGAACALTCTVAALLGAAVGPGRDADAAGPSVLAQPTATPCPTAAVDTLLCTVGATPPASPAPPGVPAPASSPTSTPGGAAGAATPSPSSSRSPSASPGATSSPSPTPTPSPTPSPTPAAIQGLSADEVATLTAQFKNSPFLTSLLEILKHPVASDRPSLLHFRVDDGGPAASLSSRSASPSQGPPGAVATGGRLASAPAAGTGGALTAAGILALVAATVAAARTPGGRAARRRLAAGILGELASALSLRVPRPVAVAATDVRTGAHRARGLLGAALGGVAAELEGWLWPDPRRRLRLTAAAVAVALPLVGGAAAATAAVSHRGGAPAPSALAQRLPAAPVPAAAAAAENVAATDRAIREEVRFTPPPTTAPLAAPAWAQLVAIEQGIGALEDQLHAQEAAIGQLARIAGNHREPPDGADAVQSSATGTVVALRNALSSLVVAHDAAKATYDRSLQAEYETYAAAAKDPVTRDQIVRAAASAPPASGVQQVVTANLDQVQAQVQQEQAIADAEKQLEQFGGLTPAQLDAIGHQQPFIAPEIGPVAQPFGPTDFGAEPPISFHGVFYPHFHTGIDIDAPLGTPLHAAADGVVILATASTDGQGHLIGYGNYLVVAHPNNFITLYGHCDRLLVKAGDIVHQGQVIALEGSTGNSTGPHVHFEIRRGHDAGGELLDPALLLAGELPGLTPTSFPVAPAAPAAAAGVTPGR